MATTQPAALTKTNWDDNADQVLAALSEMAQNIDQINALLVALGATSLLDLGDGLTTSAEATGTPDKLAIKPAFQFRFSSSGNLEPSDFFRIEADDDEPSHNPPADFAIRRAKTGITAGDVIGEWKWEASNAAGKANNIVYANIIATIVNAAAGSEAAVLKLRSTVAGLLADRFLIEGGMYSRKNGVNAIGEDQGQGSVNFHEYWRDGVLLPLQQPFTSAEQVITAGGSLTLPHSLGGTPTLIQPRLICKTAEAGYSVNDAAIVNAHHAEDNNRGAVVVPDATNLFIRYGSDAATFNVMNKTTGTGTAITNGNWRYVVKAWL